MNVTHNLKSTVKWLIKQMKFPPSFFSWVSKVIHVCFHIFALLCSVTGQQTWLYFLNQQEAKPKQIVTHSHRFSCAFCQLHVFALSSVLFGQNNCFGFGFMTLNWKPLSLFNWIATFFAGMKRRFMLTGPKMLVLSHKEIWTNLLSSGIPILNSSKSILILRFVCELIYYARTSDFKFHFLIEL